MSVVSTQGRPCCTSDERPAVQRLELLLPSAALIAPAFAGLPKSLGQP